MDMAEIVIEADIFPLVLEHAGHPDELVRYEMNISLKHDKKIKEKDNY
jgi:hypothetical protein